MREGVSALVTVFGRGKIQPSLENRVNVGLRCPEEQHKGTEVVNLISLSAVVTRQSHPDLSSQRDNALNVWACRRKFAYCEEQAPNTIQMLHIIRRRNLICVVEKNEKY